MSASNKRHGKEKHRSVLVVDSYSEIRHVIADQILRLGSTSVFEAVNGVAALKILELHSIDYIIAEWDMPQLDGFELLSFVRNDPRFYDIPFMIMSAEGDRSRVELALAAGVDEFLVKPFTARSLNHNLSLLMGIYQHERGGTDLSPHPGDEAGRSSDTKPARRETVLIVDDTPSVIDVISHTLHDEYTVLAATRGSKALQLVEKEIVDLILLDIMMPGMDGLEVCSQLKSNPLSVGIPIIFLTAKSEIDDITKGLDAGAVDYITKPANPRVLLARVRAQLSLKRERDSLRDKVDMLVENAHLREDMERMARQDLKKPLTVVINTVDAVLKGKLDLEQQIRAERIHESSYEMLSMIDHSLDLYKMEVGLYKINSAVFDIVAVAYRVVNSIRSYASENGVSIVFDAPDDCFVKGEELLSYTLINNLVKNAIEVSASRSYVRIAIICNDPVVISVHNSGVVPADLRERYFDKYIRFGKQEGLGIGAYTAKLMASIQGGDLNFTTSEEKGTTLLLTMPRGLRGESHIVEKDERV